MDQRLQPFSALAQGGRVGAHLERTPAHERPAKRVELGNPFCRWLDCARASTRGGGKKSCPEAEALGRGRGGLSTKIHVRVEGNGNLMTFILTPGQQHEATVALDLLNRGQVKRVGPGRPRSRPKRLVGDKGYSSRRFRQALRQRGIRITIPHRSNEHRSGPFDREAYRLRNRVERFFNRLKQFRRIATRYEKRAENYEAMIVLAAIVLWL
jgi:transposase